jgi:hypothetical protein
MNKWNVIHLSIVCLCPVTAQAEVVLDQEYVGSCCWGYILDYPEDYIAQTFTVGHSGQLVSVGVQVVLSGSANYKPVTDDLDVALMRTNALGYPVIDQVIASRTISRYGVPKDSNAPMIDVDFSAANLQVYAGEVLAIALNSDHTYYPFQPAGGFYQYSWHSWIRNPHPGGEFYIYSPRLWGPEPHLVRDYSAPPDNTRDMGFRVHINVVPEPNAVTAMLGALVCFGLQRRRASRESQ